MLMENVVDIVRFAGGFLGRYALGRLVGTGYQTRMGMMAAGAYGLPQFRMRMFMWGALLTEVVLIIFYFLFFINISRNFVSWSTLIFFLVFSIFKNRGCRSSPCQHIILLLGELFLQNLR